MRYTNHNNISITNKYLTLRTLLRIGARESLGCKLFRFKVWVHTQHKYFGHIIKENKIRSV